MDLEAARLSLHDFPRNFLTKNGLACSIQLLANDLHQQFIEAYLAFQPRNSFQGLPPPKDEVCIKWVREMIGTGINLIATTDEHGIIGHTALFPIGVQKCELLVVVWPQFQNIGIGTELSRSCVRMAAQLDFDQMWLPVDSTNLRARHIYTKCGFEYKSPKLARELEMVCDLSQHRAESENDLEFMKNLMDNTRIPPVRFNDILAPAPFAGSV